MVTVTHKRQGCGLGADVMAIRVEVDEASEWRKATSISLSNSLGSGTTSGARRLEQ